MAQPVSRLYCKTVAEYVDTIGPHARHESYRCDDPPARLLGRGCKEHGLEVFIAIADFKNTGDLLEFDRLMEEKFPEPKVEKAEKKAG